MALLRRGAKDRTGSRAVTALDDDVYVVSPKAAGHAVKAEKETRRAARAKRNLAKAETRALKKSGGRRGEDDSHRSDGGKTDGKGDGRGERTDEGSLSDPLTSAKVKRYLGIARILVPVITPIAYQAVGAARARWDSHRARQLGVAPGELADFTGRGAGLYARIHNIALSTRDLRTRRGDEGRSELSGSRTADTAAEVRTFADDAETRLSDLEAAVRSAEQMPSARRRSAHAAVASELDRIETRLLVLWGVGGGRRASAVAPRRD